MANEGQTFRSIKPVFKVFDNEGDSVTGYLVAREWVELTGGTCPKYIVDTDDGRMAFLGTTQIAECLEGLPMKTLVRVTYMGETKRPGGRKLREFNVEVADDSYQSPVMPGTTDAEVAALEASMDDTKKDGKKPANAKV